MARTIQLQASVKAREFEVSQLRAFTKMASATLQGRGLSPGMADGVAWVHLPSASELTSVRHPIAQRDVEDEISRLDTALAAANCELTTTRGVSPATWILPKALYWTYTWPCSAMPSSGTPVSGASVRNSSILTKWLRRKFGNG